MRLSRRHGVRDRAPPPPFLLHPGGLRQIRGVQASASTQTLRPRKVLPCKSHGPPRPWLTSSGVAAFPLPLACAQRKVSAHRILDLFPIVWEPYHSREARQTEANAPPAPEEAGGSRPDTDFRRPSSRHAPPRLTGWTPSSDQEHRANTNPEVASILTSCPTPPDSRMCTS